jgi:hypothetical protein
VREEVSELMNIFDPQKRGAVSKEEFLAIMGQEFDALNRSGTGQLNASELSRLPAAVSGLAATGSQCLKANPPPRCFRGDTYFRGPPLGPR